jgi:hypothetical protein
VYGSAVWANISSLALGVLSLFGIKRHGLGFILWKAVPGIIASGALGWLNLMFAVMSGIVC